MKNLPKNEAMQKIERYFSNETLDTESTKKIMRLAMKHRISLRDYRKRFCKKCYSDLKYGKVRVSKDYKYVECSNCKKRNAWKIR